MSYPTPHINASPSDFAPTVLMPGDPKRATRIVERYLENARLVNDVRGVQGYTGTYCGIPVTVMASGMGMPSMGIYSHELFADFGVRNIIRIGTAGGIAPDVRVRDLVIGMGASTDSAYASLFHLPGTVAPLCSYELLRTCMKCAETLPFTCHVGNLLSSDFYYADEEDIPAEQTSAARWRKMGILAVDMEAASLYLNAARLGGRALAICSVSNHLFTGESLSSEERQTSFHGMVSLALETAVAQYAEDGR